jgi:Zn-dependent M28 family amino/carboxypeptidase
VDLVAIGPRPPGSEGAQRARDLIRQRLRQAGWPVEEHRFRADLPDGSGLEMVNLIGRRVGVRSEERILIVTHYDTKAIEGIRFVGANDGASGVALLLELARQLGTREPPFTMELVFFDGEEAFGEDITAQDGLYGSRALASRMKQDGTLSGLRALVLVDMVADRDLNLSVDLGSDPALRAIVREEAERLGLGGIIDPGATLQLVDDHTPFMRMGFREVISFIDFQFGGPYSPGPYWHTARDNLDAVSQESLNSVGRLVVQTLRQIEARLRERAPEP